MPATTQSPRSSAFCRALRAAAVLAAAMSLAPGCTMPAPPGTPVASTSAPSAVPTPSATPSRNIPELSAEQRDGLTPPAGFLGPDDNKTARVFDFAEVAAVVPYCAPCTVNGLAKDFGALTQATGSWDEAGNTTVTAVFGTTTIKLSASDGGMSFETMEPDVEYPLTDGDKDVLLTLLTTTFADPSAAQLPRGLQIGESTSEDVLGAYPADSWDRTDDIGAVSYAHIWFDKRAAGFDQDASYGLTDVAYGFAADRDVLAMVRVDWAIQLD